MPKTFSDIEDLNEINDLMKLTSKDLKELVENYNQEPKGKKATMIGQLLSYFPNLTEDGLNAFTVSELQDICVGAGEEKTGNKKELVGRLIKLKGTENKRKRESDDDDEQPKKKTRTARVQDFVKTAKSIKVVIDGKEYEAKPKNFNKGKIGWSLYSKNEQSFTAGDVALEKAEIKVTIQASYK
jgi:hypothetical protein